MPKINQIEGVHVGRLDPNQFAKLLRILLDSEALQRGLVQHGIHVPSKITVADDGEDGRWDAPASPVTTEIPNSYTVYQIKAEDVSPAEWPDEVLVAQPKTKAKGKQKPASKQRKAKPAILQALAKKGCYCVFCSERLNLKQINARKEKIWKALEASDKRFKKFNIHFLEGDMIAKWVNRHAAATAFVINAQDLASKHTLRGWSAWSKDPAMSATEFQTNPYLEQHLANLRTQLVHPRQIVRVFGPSGVGKTRFVYEALRPTKDENGVVDSLLADSVVYFDLSENEDDKIDAIRLIAEASAEGILVVDNCSPTVHGKLADYAQYPTAKYTLLTVDYEKQKISSGSGTIELQPSKMIDVVPKILRKRAEFSKYTDTQIEAIARFCEGYPQIAVLMATLKAAPTEGQLREKNELLDKLIWGRQSPDQSALQVLRALAAFASLGVEGEVAGQLTFVRDKLCSLSTDLQLRQKVNQFIQLRIIQPAGKYWIVAPRPLAVALAASWWESASKDDIYRLLPELEQLKLLAPMCEQLRLLSFSNPLNNLVREMCGPGGPFARAELMFSTAGSQLFRSLAEINPESAIEALDNLIGTASRVELLKVSGNVRRNFVLALEKLCWPANLFPKAAALLLKLAAAENETWTNNATGYFKQLFHVYLSGTQQPGLARLAVIEDALASGDEKTRLVCVHALGEVLYTGTFTRMGGVEVRGSELPQEDWRPTTYKEIGDYHEAAYRMLLTLSREAGPVGVAAQKLAGQRIRVIAWTPVFEHLEADIFNRAAEMRGYWPEAHSSVQVALEHDLKEASPRRTQLTKLVEALNPTDLAHRIAQFVSQAGYNPVKTSDGTFKDLAAKRAIELGAEVGVEWQQHTDTIFTVAQGRHDKGHQFGEGLARSVRDPKAFLQALLARMKAIKPEDQSVGLLMGFLAALGNAGLNDSTLEAILHEPALTQHYFSIARVRGLTEENVAAIIGLVRKSQLPPEILTDLSYGRAVDELPANVLTGILVPLATDMPAAIGPVYRVLSMYAFNDKQRWTELKSTIRQLMLLEDFVAQLSDDDEHHWECHVGEFFKDTNRDPELAKGLVAQIIKGEEGQGESHNLDSTRKRILTTIFVNHTAEVWPLLGEALLREHGYRIAGMLSADSHFGMPGNTVEEVFSCPFWALDGDVVLPWLSAHPEPVGLLFQNVALFVTEKNNTLQWHPLILRMLREVYTPEHESEVGSNLWSFGSTGSRASYVQRRIKLLESLHREKKVSLRTLVDHWTRYFQEDLKSERERDAEHAAGIWSY